MTLWWYQRNGWIDTITWPTGLINELTEGEKLPGTQLDPPSKPTVVCDCRKVMAVVPGELAVTFVGTILRHRSLSAAAAVAPSLPEKRLTNGNIFSSYCSCILIIAAFMSRHEQSGMPSYHTVYHTIISNPRSSRNLSVSTFLPINNCMQARYIYQSQVAHAHWISI